MFQRKWQIWVMLTLSIAILGVPLAHADLYWESEQVSQGVPGPPQGPRVVKHYITPKAYRVEPGNGKIMIMDLEKKLVFQIDPDTKTYSVTNFDEIGGSKKMPKMNAEQRKMMASMMGDMQISPTNETKTINGFKCKKYLVTLMMMNSEYWLSKDVKGFDELKSMGEKMSKAFENNPMGKQMNIAAMMDKMDGFPVQTVMQVMGGTITNTLVKVEQKSLSGDLFKIPSGYTQTAADE